MARRWAFPAPPEGRGVTRPPGPSRSRSLRGVTEPLSPADPRRYGTLGGAVRLETILRQGLWPALVDPTQIEMIILNLAINARDAMEVGGGLTVETANVMLGDPKRPEEPPPGEYVALIVWDTGSGMNEEVLAKAFEPFFTFWRRELNARRAGWFGQPARLSRFVVA
jgi:hypothetical protein